MKTWRLFALLLLLAPEMSHAQVGRLFVSAETYVGVSRVVHVGKITELTQIEYDEPLTELQEFGKPHRMVFEVSETIRGDAVDRLELVLSLQSKHDLEYMRDHSIEVMLVAGPDRLTRFPGAEIGIEEQGKRVDGDWYKFRVLNPVAVPQGDGYDAKIARQLNISYDSCRMFTIDLEVISGRGAILKQVREFAKEHTEILSSVTVIVPREFGARVGDPNAYCGITFPICAESRETLIALQNDPGLILREIESEDEEFYLNQLKNELKKALAKFPDGDE
ncbi:MAG: hypothetical protein AAF585_14085 [Verrucomicrobiota bacterium]